MNLKRIVREEINDFDWVNDIKWEDILDNHFNIDTDGKEAWFRDIKNRNQVHPPYEMYNKLTNSSWGDLYEIIYKDKMWRMGKGIIKRLRIGNKLDNWKINRIDKLKDYYPNMYKKQLRNVIP